MCDEDGVCEAGGAGELKELNYGQRDAQFWGVEAKAFVPLTTVGGGKLSGQVLGDYVRAKFMGGGGDVPRIQPGRFGGGLDWDNGIVDASFLVLAVSAQDHVGVADSTTDGYTSVDAQVRWKPFKAKPGLR